MTDQSRTTCPLCLKPARIIGTTNFQRNKVFDCGGCSQFGVSDDADATIRGLPDQFKDDWRAKIRAAKPDELLVIILGPVGSGRQIEDERAPRRNIEPLP